MIKLQFSSAILGLTVFLMFLNMNLIPVFVSIPLITLIVLQLIAVLFSIKLSSDSIFRVVVTIYSSLFCIIILGCFLTITTFYIINFPPSKPFEETLTLHQLNNKEEKTYKDIVKLMNDFRDTLPHDIDNILNKHDYHDNEVQSILDKSHIAREKVFEFILENQIAIPPKSFNNIKNLSFSKFYNETNPHISNKVTDKLITFYKLELLEMKKNLDKKNFDVVSKKYERLWLFTKKILQIKNSSIVDSLVGMHFVTNLPEFYLENQKDLAGIDFGNTLNTLYEIPSLVDDSFWYAFALEYQYNKVKFENFRYRWPAFDKYDTEKKFHDINCYYINCIKGKATIRTTRYYDLKQLLSARNPCGNLIIYTSVQFENLPSSILHKKTKVSILLYAMNMNKYKNNPPLDYYTGKPIEIIDEGSFVRISKSITSTSSTSKYQNSYYTIYKP